MEILNIYVIEDEIRKENRMKSYFELINKELINGNKKNELVHFLLKNNIGSIRYAHIMPVPIKKYDNYYNYLYDEESEFATRIKEIVSKEERRIFFVDLALNEEECDVFSRSSSDFRPYTAGKICEAIAQNSDDKEFIIINTRHSEVISEWEGILDIDDSTQDKLVVECIRADTFSGATSSEQRDTIIYEAVEGLWEREDDDEPKTKEK